MIERQQKDRAYSPYRMEPPLSLGEQVTITAVVCAILAVIVAGLWWIMPTAEQSLEADRAACVMKSYEATGDHTAPYVRACLIARGYRLSLPDRK